MLPRAAVRATTNPPRIRNGTSIRSPALKSLHFRTYASSKSPRPPPPSPTAAIRPGRPPPPKPFVPASGTSRQTSPGTQIPPKERTEQPKDSINSEGPSGAAAAQTPVDGTRPKDAATHTTAPLAGDANTRSQTIDDARASQEPIAQKHDLDEPVRGTARDVTQDKVSESENISSEAAPQQPGILPDLRQGIPSTFDLEFGQAKARVQREDADSDEGKSDSPLSPAGQRQGADGDEQEGGEKQYDSKAYETSLDRRRAKMAHWLYTGILLTALSASLYLARPIGALNDVPEGLEPDDTQGWAPGKLYNRARARMGSQMGYYTNPVFPKLLPDVPESQRPPFTLVLSLEDLMIHTTWDTKHGYRTAKRPGIDYFIRYLSQYYELVLFTTVPRAIADPVVAKLDPYHFIMWPLGREATKYENGEYVKDLSYLNRDLKKTLIIDTHAAHVKNQPENAIVLPKWRGDPKDPHTKDLVALIPFLEGIATMGTDDVRTVLKSFQGKSIPEEYAAREVIAREKFQAQWNEERRRRPKFSLGSIASSLGVKGSGMGGGMVLGDGRSVSEGLAQGKMFSDQIREQGQKQYEFIEKQIREHGEEWLREEAEELRKMNEAAAKDMKQGALSWFGGGGKKE